MPISIQCALKRSIGCEWAGVGDGDGDGWCSDQQHKFINFFCSFFGVMFCENFNAVLWLFKWFFFCWYSVWFQWWVKNLIRNELKCVTEAISLKLWTVETNTFWCGLPWIEWHPQSTKTARLSNLNSMNAFRLKIVYVPVKQFKREFNSKTTNKQIFYENNCYKLKTELLNSFLPLNRMESDIWKELYENWSINRLQSVKNFFSINNKHKFRGEKQNQHQQRKTRIFAKCIISEWFFRRCKYILE